MTLNIPIYKIAAGVVVVGIVLGLVWQNRTLSEKAEKLKNNNTTLKQQNAAYKDSLEEIGQYETEEDGTRTVSEKADQPSETDTVYVPKPIEDESAENVDRKTTTKMSLKSSQVFGDEIGVKKEDYWKYDIEEEIGLYNAHLRMAVFPPGDSLSYTLRMSTDRFSVGLYNYVDEQGVKQTAIDAPASVNVSRMQSYYQPDPSQEDKKNFRIVPASASAATVIGIGGGGGVLYEKKLFGSLRFQSSITINTPLVEPEDIDVPTIYPFVTTRLSF